MRHVLYPVILSAGLLIAGISYGQPYPETPDTCSFTYQYGNSGETFFFCPEGKVKVEYRYYNKTSYGTWEYHPPRISINLNKTIGERGIRENNKVNEEERITGTQYDKFIRYIDLIDMNLSFNWDTVKSKMSDSASSEFVWNGRPNCEDFNFNQKLPGKYWHASCRTLKQKELKGLSREELKVMKNEIYARYGLRFDDPEMKKHFSKKSWYTPELDNVDAYLRKVEKRNIARIEKVLKNKN